MYLNELTNKSRMEDSNFECKALLNRQDIIVWMKMIAGFANASGGEFYIGVEDKTFRLIGFDAKEADNERHLLEEFKEKSMNIMEQMLQSMMRRRNCRSEGSMT